MEKLNIFSLAIITWNRKKLGTKQMKTDKDDKDDIFLLSHFDDFFDKERFWLIKNVKIISKKAILDERYCMYCS